MVTTPRHLFSSTSTRSSWPSWSRSPCCSSSCSSSSSPSGPPSPPSSTRSRGSLASYLLLLHYLPAYMGQWTEKRLNFYKLGGQLILIPPPPRLFTTLATDGLGTGCVSSRGSRIELLLCRPSVGLSQFENIFLTQLLCEKNLQGLNM